MTVESLALDRTTDAASVALFALDLSDSDLAGSFDLLDANERTCAARFRHARDRNRFVARRGQLRAHLAIELGIPAYALRIAEDTYGKPFLPDDPDLAFNLSHSNGLALCVTRRGGAIGCDIEWRNPELACPKVAERLFAPVEYAALRALPAEQWVAGFYNCWTRKEAYVKALGLGLSYPLDAFTVSVDEPVRFTSEEPGWSLIAFEPAPGFQAALAISERRSPPR